MKHILNLPLSDEDIKKLHIGDAVLLNGTIFTARDAVHRLLLKEKPKLNLSGSIIYHCGPITLKKGNEYKILAAGPTTSMRHEAFESSLIKKYGLKAIMGKGGMGEKTRKALMKHHAVYLQTVGGAAQVLAEKITEILDVKYLKYGEPEAMWKIEVKDFPAFVAMDSYGKSIYEEVYNKSVSELGKMFS